MPSDENDITHRIWKSVKAIEESYAELEAKYFEAEKMLQEQQQLEAKYAEAEKMVQEQERQLGVLRLYLTGLEQACKIDKLYLEDRGSVRKSASHK